MVPLPTASAGTRAGTRWPVVASALSVVALAPYLVATTIALWVCSARTWCIDPTCTDRPDLATRSLVLLGVEVAVLAGEGEDVEVPAAIRDGRITDASRSRVVPHPSWPDSLGRNGCCPAQAGWPERATQSGPVAEAATRSTVRRHATACSTWRTRRRYPPVVEVLSRRRRRRG